MDEHATTASAAPFDLASLDVKAAAERGAPVHLEHPANKAPLYDHTGAPVTITVLGYDAGPIRKLSRQMADKRVERSFKGAKFLSAEAHEADRVALCAAATVGWTGIWLDGASLPFSEANARKLYADPRMAFILEQVDAAISDRNRFFSDSSAS